MRKLVLLLMTLSGIARLTASPLSPQEVAVVFNSAVPESEKLAITYRNARNIPADNLIGLKMPATADITRAEYESSILEPLRLEFDKRKFWQRADNPDGFPSPKSNKIRVLVTIRGVPLRIKPEPKPKDFKDDPNDPFSSRDEASVDSELAVFGTDNTPVNGFLENKYFKSEKPINEANLPALVLVARIDAASLTTCERIIQDAIDTEKTGLWGRAYVDLSNKYPQGDKWLEQIIADNLKSGIPTVVDRFNDTLPKNYPMTDASLYYGWYDWNLSGPFLNNKFRFRKGAVAMHLHSFSAQQLANPAQNWSAGLLEKGAAVTIGNVYEPYLHLTHWFDVLHQRLLAGNTWVEAAWMAMPATSWQAVVLGDPLYRPFAHFDGNGPKLKEDSEFLALRLAAMRWGELPGEMQKQLQAAAERLKSGTLTEAIGLRLLENAKPGEATAFFVKARDLYPKAEDKLRQEFHLIAIQRTVPNGKPKAIQALREAKTRYAKLPEADALSGWLDILDPQAPPKANPATQPPPKNH